MTEIPEHLRKRAEARRQEMEPKTVEVPVADLELLKEWHDRNRDTPFTSDGLNVVALFQRLIALIPEPAYRPDPWLVSDYAYAQGYSTAAAEAELIQLHKAGFTVSRTDEKPERN